MTLKRRVMLALVLLVALFTALQGGLAVWSMHEQEDELVDDLVLTEARRLAQRLSLHGPEQLIDDEDGALMLPDHYEAWWVGHDGRMLPEPLPPALAGLAEGPHRDPGDAGHEYHLMVMPAAGGRLVLRYDAERHEQKVREFTWQVALLALLFLVLAAAMAVWVADLLVQPLARVARLMDHWAPAPARPPDLRPLDEESRLLAAFGRVQSRWEHALAREAELLADLRHEVRTPLAALRTDLELLQHQLPALGAESSGSGKGDGRASGGVDDNGGSRGPAGSATAQRQRVARALTYVDAVAGTLESLRPLDAARRAPSEDVPLADCVDDAWSSLGERPAQRGLVLDNEVGLDVVVRAERHALMTILRNLMRNAVDHAAPARCRVAWTGGRLRVEDDGPGIPADDLPFVFERYYRGRLADSPDAGDPGDGKPDERGLGLAIARRAAEQHGWRLAVAPAEPRGTRFELAFTTLD